MDTAAMIVVLTAASIQIALCWNLHRIYLKLHNEFKAAIDNITEKRRWAFRLNLVDLFLSSLQDIGKLDEQARKKLESVENAFKNPQYVEKAKKLFSSVIHAEQPLQQYNQTREYARTAHRYFMTSSAITFLGLIPALTGDPNLNFMYFLFVFSLPFAFNAWDNYSRSEKILVELRDQGE